MGLAARAAYRLKSRLRRLPAGSQEPQYDPVVHPQTHTRGWVLVEKGYGRVRVDVSGAGASYARLHAIERPDLASLSRFPSAPMAGWEAVIHVPDMEPGTPVTVTATAEGTAGSLRLGSVDTFVSSGNRMPVADRDWVRELERRTRLPVPARAADEPLRLMCFTHSLDLGGGQLYLHELLRLLTREGGFECLVVCATDGPLRRELADWGIPVHICERIPGDAPRYESRIAELGALARSFGADVIIANTVLAFDGIDLASRLRLPSIWAIHDSIPVERCEGGLFWGFDDHVVKRFRAAVESDAILAFEAEATLDLYRGFADDERLRRIDWGIPLGVIDEYRSGADRERLRDKHGFAPTDRMIVCVGTIEPRKAQASLALAFGQAAAEDPDAVLVFIGDRKSAYSDGLRAIISRMGPVRPRIRIEPLTPDVMQWLEMSDAFALVSDVESLPRSIMEAMAFGRPVLATRAWGVPELISDGANGLLCEPKDFESLTDGMRRLLSLPGPDASAIGSAAERTIRENRDSSHYAREYRRLLNELARGSSEQPMPGPAHTQVGTLR